MKICPTCGNSFSDDLSYCLQDGTVLQSRITSDLSSQPTEIYHPQTNPDTDISNANTIVDRQQPVAPTLATVKQFQLSAVEPASRMGCVLSIGQIAAALFVVVGLGVAGLMFLKSDTEVAGLKAPKPLNTASNSGAPTNASNAYGNSSSTPAATRTPGGGSKTLAGGDLTGKARALPQPAYPPAARAVKASGTVIVQVLIGEDGRVISANAVSGHPLLKDAAAQAARNALFDPTLTDGVPVKVSGTIKYNFEP